MKKTPFVLILFFGLPLLVFNQGVDWSKKTLQTERTRSYDARHYLIRIELDLDGKAF